MKVDLPETEEMEVQMAPLIDCVFLLLIFFLVATTLKEVTNELDIELPESKASASSAAAADYLLLSIDPEDNYFLNGEPASLETIQEKLDEITEVDKTRRIRLDVDRAATFDSIIAVFDELSLRNLENVYINTDRAGDGSPVEP